MDTLDEVMNRMRYSPRAFFQIAYMWKFNRYYDPTPDVRTYVREGIIPYYVSSYLSHLEAQREHPRR